MSMNREQRRLAKKLAGRKPVIERRVVPSAVDEWEQFDSIERMFQKLRNGEIEYEGNTIVIMGLKGEYYGVLAALEGWTEYWAEVADRNAIAYDDGALRRLAKSLEYNKPLNLGEVNAAYAVVEQQRQMFRTLPRRHIAQVAIEVMQKIQRTDEIRELMRAAA
jgi:hypothetical protein